MSADPTEPAARPTIATSARADGTGGLTVQASGADAGRRRGRVCPWLIGVASVITVLIFGLVVAEQVARDRVIETVRTRVIEALGLPESAQLDIVVPGTILPQLIGGSLDEITIAGDDLTVGGITADIVAVARDVSVREGADIGGAVATVRIDEAEFARLISESSDIAIDSVALASPAIDVESHVELFGAEIPIQARVIPEAVAGEVSIKTVSITVAGVSIDVDALRKQFGGIADVLGGERTICIADQLPAGLTLSGLEIAKEAVVATVEINPAIASDSTLSEPGSCGSGA